MAMELWQWSYGNGAMGKSESKYSPDMRERALRVFQEHVHEYPPRWAAMHLIVAKIGCTTETLRSWVQRAEAQSDQRRDSALADRERLKQLERENAELVG